MPRHLTREELDAGVEHILAAPKDAGRLEGIVVRPAKGERRELDRVMLSRARGTEGDHWARGCWMSTDEGAPHPDVQICIMNARCIDLVAAGERDRWKLAGDNLFLDMDLSQANLPAGTRLRLGEAELEITEVPHNGCASFIERFGRDACIFVNTGPGKPNRLRGVYARVERDGQVAVGDLAVKIV